MNKTTNKTIDSIINNYTKQTIEQYQEAIQSRVIDFSIKYVPGDYNKNTPRFKNYWVNNFLEKVYWGMRHPIIDNFTGRHVHPLLAQDAAWIESAQVVDGIKPDYRFVILPDDHWELIRFGLTSTFHDVFTLRIKEQGGQALDI